MSTLLEPSEILRVCLNQSRFILAWVESNGERVEHNRVFAREIAGREYPVLTVYVDNRMYD